MIIRTGRIVPSLLSVGLLLLGSGCVSFSSMTPGQMEWIQPESKAPRVGTAYLTRGLIGMFSHGIDVLTERVDASGVRAHVFQEDQHELVAQTLVERYKNRPDHEPIVLIGHSLGADASIYYAHELQKAGVEVDVLITLDATRPMKVPGNVKVCYNYYQPSIFDGTGMLRGIPLETEPNFHGKLYNMNVRDEYKHLLEWDTNHVNIDKNTRIHADVIARVQAICPPREQWVAARQGRAMVPTTQPYTRGPGNLSAQPAIRTLGAAVNQ